ncbi:glycoside hydrolase family 13 protein [Arthrobacter sp. EPSL27]|uniref:glycoside hydrolase family 13 protein n=1 Tax=Arthrobacter sp. EPSL27 TaxID=1745378 RepID=UPI0007497452|nr:glycoside hydrolase family 13 protein [Arthrobacter sp. EPSL27]KUM36882.1 alpha-glycosidase [Arthrobacter sp. EPSL27]
MTVPGQTGPLPHHDGSALYAPQQPDLGDEALLRVRIPAGWGRASRVWLRSIHDGEPRYAPCTNLGEADGWAWWEAAMTVTNPVARYRFLLEVPDGQAGPDDDDGGAASEAGSAGRTRRYWSLNAQGLFSRDVSDYADFRLATFPSAPQWLRTGTMYQVFPDRFARSAAAEPGIDIPAGGFPEWAVPCSWDTTEVQGAGPQTPYQFYGGDLGGITEKLDHIQQLGADVIYLTPFFPARSNHRYDASTFESVDPLLGGDQALVELVAAAHARGLKVMGDLTANHTGDAHEWFRRARSGPGSPEAGYYHFHADGTGYEAWYGVASLPKLNWTSDALRERFVLADDSPVARWLKPPFNLDGWRIDVGNMTGRLGATDLNQDVARLIARRVREINPDAALLAEATNDAAPDFTGEHWHGAMTYSNFTRPLWSWLAGDAAHVNFFGTPLPGPNRTGAEDFLATHLDLAAAFSWDVRQQNMNALNSHDTARAATVMIDGGQLLGAVLMFTLPGVPVVFAGDEFGLEGYNGEASRTPMPWNDPGRVRTDLRDDYAALADLRRNQPALTGGGIRWLYAHGDAMVFIRETGAGSVLVAVARAAADVVLPAGALTGAQLAALAEAPAYATGPVDAVLPAARQVRADAAPPGALICTRGAAAAVWVLPGTLRPQSGAGGA